MFGVTSPGAGSAGWVELAGSCPIAPGVPAEAGFGSFGPGTEVSAGAGLGEGSAEPVAGLSAGDWLGTGVFLAVGRLMGQPFGKDGFL